jgi:hypothetical protein
MGLATIPRHESEAAEKSLASHDFDASVQGGTIILAGSELTVASDVAIDGGAGVTIDAQQASLRGDDTNSQPPSIDRKSGVADKA